jgi:hypothetical protein
MHFYDGMSHHAPLSYDDVSHGFMFAFKVFHKRPPIDSEDEEDQTSIAYGSHHHCHFANHLENLVHCLTRSDIIHVELIPVIGRTSTTAVVSQTAYSAYVGVGFDEHDSSFCITDPTFRLIYIPMPYETMLQGIQFLHAQRGKQYNYLALPLTILPTWCKRRKIDVTSSNHSSSSDEFYDYDLDQCDYYYNNNDETTRPQSDRKKNAMDVMYNPSKVFCSQLGLSLCYLCQVFSDPVLPTTEYEEEIQLSQSRTIMDPMCCTPADLFKLLISLMSEDDGEAPMEWPQSYVVLHESL